MSINFFVECRSQEQHINVTECNVYRQVSGAHSDQLYESITENKISYKYTAESVEQKKISMFFCRFV